MIYNLRLNKIFWSIPTLLALLAASAGVINRDIYIDLFPKDFLPGAFPQDILTIIVSFFMFFLIKITKKDEIKPQIIIVGLLGSLFYLYGIFTI
jgi:hypothetical protein